MSTIVFWAVVMALLAGLAFGAVIGLRAYKTGITPGSLLFKPKPEPRLAVVELANMDGRRKLILIRRDDVEHLVMTGGPVDVVIETGIGDKRQRLAETAPQAATVFSRPPRTLGQVAGSE